MVKSVFRLLEHFLWYLHFSWADFKKIYIKQHLRKKCETMVKSAWFHLSSFSSYPSSKNGGLDGEKNRKLICFKITILLCDARSSVRLSVCVTSHTHVYLCFCQSGYPFVYGSIRPFIPIWEKLVWQIWKQGPRGSIRCDYLVVTHSSIVNLSFEEFLSFRK